MLRDKVDTLVIAALSFRFACVIAFATIKGDYSKALKEYRKIECLAIKRGKNPEDVKNKILDLISTFGCYDGFKSKLLQQLYIQNLE